MVSKRHPECFRQCFTSQDCARVKKNNHIHHKQRKARAISESLILLLMYPYTDFAFEDVLQLISL